MQSVIQKFVLYMTAICAAWMLSGWAPTQIFVTHYDDTRAVELIILMLLMISALSSITREHAALHRLPLWPSVTLLCISALGLISAARSPHPIYGYIDVGLFTALGLAALHIRATVTAELRRQLLIVVSLGGIFLGLRLFFELIAALLTSDPRGLVWSWLPFLQQRFFAKAAGWSLPLIWLLPQLMPTRRKPLLAFSGIASIMIASQLIGTGSRGALLGLALSMIVAAALFRKPGTAYAAWMLASLALGFLIWEMIEIWLGYDTSGRLASTSISGRGPIYAALLADLNSAPWLGIGPMQFSTLGRHPDLNIAGAHGALLQIGAEWGVPILIMGLALSIYWDARYATRIRALAGGDTLTYNSAAIEVALFAAFVLSAVHSLVANVINDPVSQLVAAVLIGLALPTGIVTRGAARPIVALVGAMGILSCAVVPGMALRLGYPCIRWSAEVTQIAARDGLVYSRLWSQGLIPYSQTCQISDRNA